MSFCLTKITDLSPTASALWMSKLGQWDPKSCHVGIKDLSMRCHLLLSQSVGSGSWYNALPSSPRHSDMASW